MNYIYFTVYKWMFQRTWNSVDLYWKMERNTPENTTRFRKELNEVEGGAILLDVRETKATKTLSDIHNSVTLFNRSRGMIDLENIKCEKHILKYELNVCDILHKSQNLMLLNPVIEIDTTKRQGFDSYGRYGGKYYQANITARTFIKTNSALHSNDEFLENFSRISPSFKINFRIDIDSVNEEDLLNDMCV